jgi:Rod binding domain-containing protein
MTPIGAPSAVELADPARAKVWKAAQEFETMTIGQLLAPMFETVKPQDGPFGGGAGEEAFRPMLTQELAKGVSHAGGLGLAGPIYRQMLQIQEAKDQS